MPVMPLDLEAYLERIGYVGPRDSSLATLHALHVHHVNAIPFENLDVLLGRVVQLDLPSLQEKLVHSRRGGYCFEQNTLFAEVLRALGFKVASHLARIRWQKPANEPTPLTHMVLRVTIDQRDWLADVGLGGVGMTAPLALDTDLEQSTPHEPRRLVRNGHQFTHRIRMGDTWDDVYVFTLEDPLPIDFEIANWFSCSHSKAHFMNNLVVARVDGVRRITILNRELTLREGNGVTRRELSSPEELLQVLAEHFGLHFPAGTRFGLPGLLWS